MTSTIIDYCQRCDGPEGKAIVAFCCYMAFRDKSVRRMEVDTIHAIAEQMGLSPFETAKMARKARKRRLKIKEPKSKSARALLFHLALRMAVADQFIDERERAAIHQLAGQLKIPDDRVDQELSKLAGAGTKPKPPDVAKIQSSRRQVPDQRGETGAAFFTGLSESMHKDLVVEDLEADLFCQPPEPQANRRGEVEYTLNHHGDTELNVEIDDNRLAPGQKLSVIVAGALVSDIIVPVGRIDQTFRSRDGVVIPTVVGGDSAEIQSNDTVFLAGAFESN